MWTIIKIPANYTATNDDDKWCIIDDDGDVHDFFSTKEEAEDALRQLLLILT